MNFRILTLALMLGLVPAAAPAAVSAGSLGAGIRIGDLTGVDFKFWASRTLAINMVVGSMPGNSVALQGALLLHRYNLFHSERDDLENSLPLYFGVGGIFADRSTTPYGIGATLGGVKGILGISYLFASEPFDVFLELSPTFYIQPVNSFLFHAGLGGRFYF